MLFIEYANAAEWDVVSEIAEVIGTNKSPRLLNPAILFKVNGLDSYTTYEAKLDFFRSDMKHKYSTEEEKWVPWQTGAAPFPQQSFSLDPALGCDMGTLDFSRMKLIIEGKANEKADIIVQTHHVYTAQLSIFNVDTQEAVVFDIDRIKFLVITNPNPRYNEQKKRLDALKPPKEAVQRKRAAKDAAAAPKAPKNKKSVEANYPLKDRNVEAAPVLIPVQDPSNSVVYYQVVPQEYIPEHYVQDPYYNGQFQPFQYVQQEDSGIYVEEQSSYYEDQENIPVTYQQDQYPTELHYQGHEKNGQMLYGHEDDLNVF